MNAPGYEIPRDGYSYPQYVDAPVQVYAIPMQKYRPVLSPKGLPSRSYFVIGGVGMFLTAALAICLGVFGLLTSQFLFYGYYSGTVMILSLILGIILYIGLLLGLVGFYGFYKNYGSGMGIAAFGFGIVATTFYLVSLIVMALTVNSFSYYYGTSILAILVSLIGLVLVGILFILEGVSFMRARHFTHTGEVNLAAGIMLVIAGSFFCSLFLAHFGGYFLLATSAIIGGIVFAMSPIPVPVSRPPLSKKVAVRKRPGIPEGELDNPSIDYPDWLMPDEEPA